MFKTEAGRVVIAGGSGFLGRDLQNRLNALGHRTVCLTRQPGPNGPLHEDVSWDGKSVGQWKKHLDGAHLLINLTGKSVNCRYTEENKKEIVDSRVNSVKALAEALRQISSPPPCWLQASSLAIYGSPEDRICTETSPTAEGFSESVCKAWEGALFSEPLPRGIRRVALRIGFALGKGGGALEPLSKLARLGLGGKAGNGKQYISWLHNEDLFEFVCWLADQRGDASVAYNVCSPSPVTNAEFMKELRRALHRPWSPPVPAWAVRLGARFILNTEADLALSGRRCIPERAEQEGFRYRFRDLRKALETLT